MKLNLSINTVNNTLQKSQAFVFFHLVQLSFSESVDLFSWCTGDWQLTWCLSRLKLSVSFSNHTSNLCEIQSHWRSVGSQELLARFSLFHANFYISCIFVLSSYMTFTLVFSVQEGSLQYSLHFHIGVSCLPSWCFQSGCPTSGTKADITAGFHSRVHRFQQGPRVL